MGKFKKGDKKPINSGKKKGSKNKRTEEQLKRIEYVLEILDTSIDKDIKALEPRERAKLWVDLQEYIRPKLARTELVGNGGKDLIPHPPTAEELKASLEKLENEC